MALPSLSPPPPSPPPPSPSLPPSIELTSTSSMNLPYLKITYASWLPDSAPSSSSSATPLPLGSHQYSTVYVQSSQPIILGLSITTVLLFLILLCYAGIRVNGLLRRSGALFCEPHVSTLDY